MYTCGLTVYNYGHIGNYRSFICADIIRRYLEYKGYRVKYIKNITDVGHLREEDLEDKMIFAAKKAKKGPEEIARFYTEAFFEDEKKLNIKKADVYPKATKHIKDMKKIIKILLKKGYAYEISDGIYFHVPKFKNYGKLSGNTLDKLKKGARIEPNPEKKHPADFSLWKKASPEHLMQWPSIWGRGFPGWHIECSTMSMKYLGKTLDIHTGGEDNIFPHHENEIAQSEAVTSKKFVKYWTHVRFLLVEGKKMAKSKGNFYTLRDLENKGYSPLAFRLLVLNVHYRTHLNFTFRGLKQAEANIQRVYGFIDKLEELKSKKRTIPSSKGNGLDAGRGAKALVLKTKKEFEKAMDDDFNTPAALSSIFHLINRGNWLFDRNRLTSQDAKDILKALRKIDKAFAFIFRERKKEKIPQNVLKLVKLREKYRKEQKWQKADEVRREIKKLEYQIEDTAEGPKVKSIK